MRDLHLLFQTFLRSTSLFGIALFASGRLADYHRYLQAIYE